MNWSGLKRASINIHIHDLSTLEFPTTATNGSTTNEQDNQAISDPEFEQNKMIILCMFTFDWCITGSNIHY
jgi:hypothetical protein